MARYLQRALELLRIVALVLALSLLFGGLALYLFGAVVTVAAQLAAVAHAVVGIGLFAVLALLVLLEVASSPRRLLAAAKRAILPLLVLVGIVLIAAWTWSRIMGSGMTMGPPVTVSLYLWTAGALALAVRRAIGTGNAGRIFDASPQVFLVFAFLSVALLNGDGAFKSGTPWMREVHAFGGVFLIAYLLRGLIRGDAGAVPAHRRIAPLLGRCAVPALVVAALPHLAALVGAIPFDPPGRPLTRPVPDLGPTRVTLESGRTFERGQYERLAQTCGTPRCHPTHVRDWQHSTHRRAASDRLYRASLELLIAERGAASANWCEGCHSPADLVMADGRNERVGVDCLTCHLVTSYTTDGNASFTLRELVHSEREYLGVPGSPLWMYLLGALPQLHKQQFDVSRLRESEFCESCHRIVLPTSVSGHSEDILLAADYHDMANSALGRRGFRCQDCHMKRVLDEGAYSMSEHLLVGGGLTDAQTEGDTAMLEMNSRWLAGDVQARLHAFASPNPWANPRLQGVEHYLDLDLDARWQGDVLLLDYRVTNAFIGHAFPKLFDLVRVWMEIEVHDADGTLLAHVGKLDAAGEIVGPAPTLGATQVDANGEPITHHRVWEIRRTIDRRVLMPEESLSETVPIHLQRRPRGTPISVTARWNFQRTEPGYLSWAVGDAHGPPVHVALVEERITVAVPPVVAAAAPPLPSAP